LLAIDVVLEAVAARVSEQGVDRFGAGLEQEYLGQVASRLPETGALFIADKTGNVIAGTVSHPPVNVSDRAWFKALRDGSASLYIGRALEGRSVHTHFFPVARSIRGPGDTFLGAVQVGVEVTYIASLFRSLNVGPGAHLGLYEIQEGAVVARYPMSAPLLGETVGGLPYFSSLAIPRDLTSPPPGRERLNGRRGPRA
jgi:hypothetical protein